MSLPNPASSGTPVGVRFLDGVPVRRGFEARSAGPGWELVRSS